MVRLIDMTDPTLLVTIIVASIGGVVWITKQFSEVKDLINKVDTDLTDDISEIKLSITTLDARLESLEDDEQERWSKLEMENWALKLGSNNEGLEVPEVPRRHH